MLSHTSLLSLSAQRFPPLLPFPPHSCFRDNVVVKAKLVATRHLRHQLPLHDLPPHRPARLVHGEVHGSLRPRLHLHSIGPNGHSVLAVLRLREHAEWELGGLVPAEESGVAGVVPDCDGAGDYCGFGVFLRVF